MQASDDDRAPVGTDEDTRALVRERVSQLRRSGALVGGSGPEHDEARAFVRARLAQLRQATPPVRVAPVPRRPASHRPPQAGRYAVDAPSVRRPAHADEAGDHVTPAFRDGGGAPPPVPMPGVTADALRARRAARSASPAAAFVAPDVQDLPDTAPSALDDVPAPAHAPAPARDDVPALAHDGAVNPARDGGGNTARHDRFAPARRPAPGPARAGAAGPAHDGGVDPGGDGRAAAPGLTAVLDPVPVPAIDERADAAFDDTVVLPRRREVHGQERRRTAVPWAAAVTAIAVLGGSGIGVTAMNAGGLSLLGARPAPTPSLAASPTASPSPTPSPSPSPTETAAAAPVAETPETPPPPPPPQTHTVDAADTLQSIALLFGLDPDDGWRRLFDANPEIERPELLPVGLVVRIPDAAEVLAPRALPTEEPSPEPTEEEEEEEDEEAPPADDDDDEEEVTTPVDDAPAVASGSVWDDLAACESGGNWSINTGNNYYGGLQFSLSSWRAVGGTGYPHEHSREEQIRRGEILQDAQGWGAWPSCSEQLGLT